MANAYRVTTDVLSGPNGVRMRDEIVDGDDYPDLLQRLRSKSLEPMLGVKVPVQQATPEMLTDDLIASQQALVAANGETEKARADHEAEMMAHSKTLDEAAAVQKKMQEEIAGLERDLVNAKARIKELEARNK